LKWAEDLRKCCPFLQIVQGSQIKMMKKTLFPLLILGVLTLHGASGVRPARHSDRQKSAIPEVNKTLVDPSTRNPTRRRSPERHLRRFISRMTRKHQHK
jgi:hypothetical protein